MITKLYAQRLTTMDPRVGTAAPAITVQNTPIRVYYLSAEMKTEWVNLSNVGCYLTIYECHPKRGTTFSPPIAWADGLEQTQGHDNAGVGIGDIQYYQFPVDSHPNESAEFKNLWAIDMKREVFLGPGDTHVHRTLFAPHKQISSAELFTGEDGSALTYMRDFTRVLMFTQRGTPVKLDATDAVANEDGTAGTEIQFMTTGRTQLGMLFTKKYKYSQTDFGQTGDIDISGSMFSTSELAKIREEDGDEVPVDFIA